MNGIHHKLRTSLLHVPLEAWTWTAALVGLGIWGPALEGHATFCIPTLLGFEGCWGCGLGRSIGHALRGDLAGSLEAHWLGIPAIVLFISRIVTLTIRSTTFAGGSHGQHLPIPARH
ncbi:MAG: DUF2752 domain-containing protein [Bacteroidetes bacterium]|nr:DUF2752 domain-containing protein [Bacteroidota bacterium]